MNIIESLAFNIGQSKEYGGIYFAPSKREGERWLNSLRIAERFFVAFEEFDRNPSTKTLNTLDEMKVQWYISINPSKYETKPQSSRRILDNC